jgi:hypothetical protein
MYWTTVSAALFDCCCTSSNLDCKQTFIPIKILDVNMKYLHNIMIFCVCGNSRVRHWVLFLNNCIIFSIEGSAITMLMIAMSLSVRWNICGLHHRKYFFWIGQKCSLLSCNYCAVSQHEMQTQVLPLIQHHMICLLMQWKKLVTFAELVFTSTSFLVLLAFHMGSKIKGTPVRHRLSTKAKNLNIFGKLRNSSDSILKPER